MDSLSSTSTALLVVSQFIISGAFCRCASEADPVTAKLPKLIRSSRHPAITQRRRPVELAGRWLPCPVGVGLCG